ncbi:unnamed protein product [Dicrocoelium dendriticum]|nr:unnamed protein product [Dicrocoelium dendriticum]
MSSFKKFFGAKKPDPKNTREALRDLEEKRDLLVKKSELYERKIQEEITIAKKYGMENKNKALKALAKKKFYERQLQKFDNTLLVIESQMQALDNAGMNLEVFNALKSTSETLKNLQKNMNVDNVHDIMDEIADHRAAAEEISDAISNTGAFGLEYDEDELLAELERYQAEDLEKQLLDVGAVSNLPSVPSQEVPHPSTSKVSDKTLDRDLKDLLDWAQ